MTTPLSFSQRGAVTYLATRLCFDLISGIGSDIFNLKQACCLFHGQKLKINNEFTNSITYNFLPETPGSCYNQSHHLQLPERDRGGKRPVWYCLSHDKYSLLELSDFQDVDNNICSMVCRMSRWLDTSPTAKWKYLDGGPPSSLIAFRHLVTWTIVE